MTLSNTQGYHMRVGYGQSADAEAPNYSPFWRHQHYKRALFLAGKGLQSAELNEVQEYLHNEIAMVGSTLFDNASIIRGGAVAITLPTTLNPNATPSVKVAASTVWLTGYSIDVPEADITIAASGREAIGVALSVKDVTYIEDETLKDPASGTKNYNKDGAARLEIRGRWVSESTQLTSEESFSAFYVLVDGALVTNSRVAPELGLASNLLARYDNDSNGHYVVRGFRTSYSEDVTVDNEDLHQFLITEGVCHVQGFEVIKQYAQKHTTRKATDKAFVTGEGVSVGTTYTPSTKYTLGHNSIAQINSILIKVHAVDWSDSGTAVTRGSGNSDPLRNVPVDTILSVCQGGTFDPDAVDPTRPFGEVGTTYYILGTDFRISDGGLGITWLTGGGAVRPVTGTGYNVSYTYTYQGEVSCDIAPDGSGILNFKAKQGGTPITPAKNSSPNVSYSYYIPRRDRLVVTKQGEFVMIEGQPSNRNVIAPPELPSCLSIATILVRPNEVPIVNVEFYRAFLMSDIQRLFSRLDNAEYNIARLGLLEDIKGFDAFANKKNMFVDPFKDTDLMDPNTPSPQVLMVNEAIISNIDYTIIQLRDGANIYLDNANEAVAINQPLWTHTIPINEFCNLLPPPPLVNVIPAQYQWISRSVIASRPADQQVSWTTWLWWEIVTTTQTTSFQQGGQSFSQDVPTAIPAINLAITSNDAFNSGEPVKVMLEGVELRGVGNVGFVANLSGAFAETVVVPASKFLSGRKLIQLIGQHSNIIGQVLWDAVPILSTTNWVGVTSTTQVLNWIWRGGDPLAQTFRLSYDAFISSIYLAFPTALSNLTLNGNPVPEYLEVSICETQLGLPDANKILGSIRLSAITNVNVQNASSEPLTKVVFPTPIHVIKDKEYAFIIATNSTRQTTRSAQLGEKDKTSGKLISSNAYETGVLLKSSNLSTWTPVQAEDVQFKMMRAGFTLTKEIVVSAQDFAVTDVTDLCLLATVQNLPGTSVIFTATFVSDPSRPDMVLEPHSNYTIVEYSGTLLIKAHLSTLDPNVTPIVSGAIQLAIGRVSTSSDYHSMLFPIDASATTLNIYVDALQGALSDVVVRYKDSETTWSTPIAMNTGEVTDHGFIEYKNATPINIPQGVHDYGKTQVQITLTADPTNINRPAARKLRAYCS